MQIRGLTNLGNSIVSRGLSGNEGSELQYRSSEPRKGESYEEVNNNLLAGSIFANDFGCLKMIKGELAPSIRGTC